MYFIDSHCHLHDQEFFTTEQAEEMIRRAKEADVQKIVCIGTSHEDSLAAHDFATTHDSIYWTYGIHPGEATSLSDPIFLDSGLEFLRLQKSQSPTTHACPVAIGEVGLDYHYEGYSRDAQIRLFEQMLQLAKDNDLPVSFHVREAFDDFFPIVANFPKIRGVIHSFTDNKKNLRRILDETNFYVGVNGMATYSTLPTPPLERILLETDAPFLTPEPFRGIINEPGYIPAIAKWLSVKLPSDIEIIKQETTKNAEQLFNLHGSFV